MGKLSVRTWIGNAAAVLCGGWGAVTAQTGEAGCSRQAAYEHAGRVEDAVADAQQGGPGRAELARALAEVRAENAQLWEALGQAVDFPAAKQRHFAVLAAALGLSLNQTARLLAVVLPAGELPSRAQLGRWVRAAANQAGPVLEALDRACVPLVRELCLDEIFCHRQPVLVGVEPHSLAWVLGRRADDRTGDTWHEALKPWKHLESVVSDAGTGLQAGLGKFREARPQTPEGRPLETGLDLFHTQKEAQAVLRVLWSPVDQAWRQAEEADRVLAAKRWHGDKGPAQTAAHAASRAWNKVAKVWAAYEPIEVAWRRAAAAFELFRPDGRLNDRTHAEAEIAAALEGLTGPRWAKVRNFVQDRRSLTFLDRLHRQLAEAEPRPEVRAALAQLWRLRHAGRRGTGPKVPEAQAKVRAVVQALVCRGLAEDWATAYRRVARVLSRAVRASSVVECMNSVVRMHQARHRTLSQPLLDLKRLYWNCRAFAGGKRRDACPYQHLGLALPTYDWWELLQTDPKQLTQQLSPKKVAA
jgi:hypothetical protein